MAFRGDFSRDAFSFGLTFYQLVAGDAASFRAGHTGRTQGKSYSSFEELGSQEVIRMSHAALGKNSTLRRAQNSPLSIITEQKTRHSMDDVLGCKSNYTCPEQQQLTQFAVNERYKDSIGNLACGMGKSMAISVHVMARCNYSTIDGTTLVIMPDRSLIEQQFCKVTDIFSGKDVSIGRYYQNDIVGSDGLDILKHQIAFVSINAWQKTSVDCGDVLKKWQEDRPIDLMFVDEIHLLYDQYEIRANEFNSLPNLVLVDLGAPVILLTATLPKALSTCIPLVKFLRLGNDVEYIGGDSYDAPDVEINIICERERSSGRYICKDM